MVYKTNKESSNYMMLRRIGGPLVKFKRVLGFSPKVLWYELQTTNISVVELFLDDFHDDFLGVMNYRSCMK